MTKRQLKNQILASYEYSAASSLEAIKLSCADVVQESVMPDYLVVGQPKRSYGAFVRRTLVATAFALLVFFGGLIAGMLIQSVGRPAKPAVVVGSAVTDIFIDVNPSIELTLDRNGLVVSCTAVNDDAEKILRNLDLEGTKFSVALSVIAGSLYMNGYLQGETDAMLVSVDTNLPDMLEDVNRELKNVFQNNSLSCELLVQAVKKDEVVERADENGISSGKMELIDRILEKSEELSETDIKELAERNIRYLTDLLKTLLNPGKEPGDDSGSNQPGETDGQPNNSQTSNGNGVSDLPDDVEKLVEDVLDESGNIVNDVLNEAGNTVDNALDKAENTVDNALDKAENTVDNALDKAENAVDNALDTAEKLINNLVNAFTGLFNRP